MLHVNRMTETAPASLADDHASRQPVHVNVKSNVANSSSKGAPVLACHLLMLSQRCTGQQHLTRRRKQP